MQSALELGAKINWEGGVGEYIASYASRASLDDYDVTSALKAKFRTAWDAMQDFIDAAEEEGVFGSEA